MLSPASLAPPAANPNRMAVDRSGQVVAPVLVLRSTHMESIAIRELQQHSSAVIRRVRAGETLGVTDRGTLVAVLVPPSSLRGSAALVASGRVRRATVTPSDLPPPSVRSLSTSSVLDDLRADD